MESQIDLIFIRNALKLHTLYDYDAAVDNLKWLVKYSDHFSIDPTASRIEVAKELLSALETTSANAYVVMRSNEYQKAVRLSKVFAEELTANL